MNLEILLRAEVKACINELYGQEVDDKLIQFQKTRREFAGDLTLVVFPLLRTSKKSPEVTAEHIGTYLKEKVDIIDDFNVIKGFLNIVVSKSYWIGALNRALKSEDFGIATEPTKDAATKMIEYSSPNTNKPLHLGHIRNNLLGYSVAQILKGNGHNVVKVNLVNDRGIHICKSMLAWQKWGEGATPESTGKKGDHLVGDYYVKFDQEYKKQVNEIVEQGRNIADAKNLAPLMEEAREMLRKWEAKDPEVYKLWKTMNDWVYDGFDVTYKTMGVDFDKIYHESETYLLGKDVVENGLADGVFYKKEDNSVWCDLTSDGLDQKLLLRADGTSVYMTQDIGTAILRYNDYHMDQISYVVGNEQEYHFKVLSLVLGKLGYKWAKDIYHLSYGMVELPEGKMKSREGTVVDADDLMKEMVDTAREMSEELGKLDGYSDEEKEDIYRIIGMGALKYYILKVDPKRTMTFNPKESIDFNGNTGPFIQYTHARIKSLLRKAESQNIEVPSEISIPDEINQKEIELIKMINDFAQVVNDAGKNFSPALIANYEYDLVKEFNQFYHDFGVLNETNESIKLFRLAITRKVGEVIKTGMGLMGIEVPERM